MMIPAVNVGSVVVTVRANLLLTYNNMDIIHMRFEYHQYKHGIEYPDSDMNT